MIYPMRKTIAVDVDGTLHRGGVPSKTVVDFCRRQKSKGYSLILWSARGEAHARQAAELFNVTDLFDVICSKPGYIIDDKGWSWIKFTKILTGLSDLPSHDA